MSRGRLLVMLNSNASRADELAGPGLSALEMAGYDVVVRTDSNVDAMRRGLQKEGRDCDCIVIAGGDGSVHAALPALLQINRPFGILPLGTANDLALTLGIPGDPIAAADVIVEGYERRLDVGHVNGIAFVNVASIGLAVQVVEHQNAERKRKWGVASYAMATFEALADASPFSAVIDCDGQRHRVRAYQITVGNGVYYGGGMRMAPDAAIDDGFFDIYAIETRSIAELVTLAPAVRAGTYGSSDEISVFRCRRLRIETERAARVSADGEVVTETPAEFIMTGGALAVRAPKAV